MIEALMAGTLVGKPEARTAKSGRTFVQARLRVPAGAEEVIFARLTAFSDSSCTALLALDDGDAAAVAGTLELGAWVDRHGDAKPNVDMVVSQVLTIYHLKRRLEAVHGAGEPGATDPPVPPHTANSPSSRRRRPAASKAVEHPPGESGVVDFGDASDDAWLRGAPR